MKHIVYPVFIPHSGCQFRCLFCDQTQTTGQRRAPSLDELLARFDAWLPASGQGQIAFYGGSFTLLPLTEQRAYLELASGYVARGRASGIRLSTRPDALDAVHLELLAHYPVKTIEVGCQSFSDQVLRASQRGYSVDQMCAGLKRLMGFSDWQVGLQLMPGLPASTPQEALESLNCVLEFRPDFIRIYPAVIFPGTGLERLFRSGGFIPLALQSAVELVARMVGTAQLAGIRVERVGLQGAASWDHFNGGPCAGPYHPAFGQLVKSELWRQVLERALIATHGKITVHQRHLGDAIGHSRSNLDLLVKRFGAVDIQGSSELDETTFKINETLFTWRQQLQGLQGKFL